LAQGPCGLNVPSGSTWQIRNGFKGKLDAIRPNGGKNMADAKAPTARKMVNLVFDRDLTDAEVEQIRQKTDAVIALVAATEAAHHHDVTK
jgi:hypothetical protein